MSNIYFKEQLAFSRLGDTMSKRDKSFNFVTHPLRFWSNFAQMFLLIKQKWGNFFHLTLNGSWGIGFWNSVKFSNVFAPAETVIFRLLFGDFWLNAVNFAWNFDQWWHARWCNIYATAFIEIIRNGQNFAKKLIFGVILRGFLFMFSYTLWIMSQGFTNGKTLLRYIFVGRVSSV